MTLLSWIAVAVIFVTIWALIKRWETRLVLIAAGLFLCIISLNPMMGLNQFAKSMTNNSLIMAICGSMGFAFTATYTQCDRSPFPGACLDGDHVFREHCHSVGCGLRRCRGLHADSADAARGH